MADWVTISALATAGGTLVLAGATFASVRSANRAARAAERSMLAGMRPLLMPSRLEDPPQKIGFADRWFTAPGAGGIAEVSDAVVYLAFGVRNAGTGIAVLHGWYLNDAVSFGGDASHVPLERFRPLTRDLYIPASDAGFWQGAFRDPAAPEFAAARRAVEARERLVVDVLYGDHEGGQRVVTRFSMTPRESDGWMVSAARHWNIDRPDPR
ncbi:MAG TPA: hypothetical protein VF327_12535 [Gaiellaceae bacterium]